MSNYELRVQVDEIICDILNAGLDFDPTGPLRPKEPTPAIQLIKNRQFRNKNWQFGKISCSTAPAAVTSPHTKTKEP